MGNRKCDIPGCSRPHYAKGWCFPHYLRARAHGGDPLGGGISPGEALAYFQAHVEDDTEECIVWPYATSGGGYGQIRLRGQLHHVHVLACEHHYGPMPEPGMMAIHAPVVCHNPPCFNWRHLRWGTQKQNMGDITLDGTNFNSNKTHCPAGHAYDEANTRTIPSRPGWRYCRACHLNYPN
jgi:hypothetical protein